MQKCYKCNSELEISLNSGVSRSQTCPSCFTDIRCCKMCTFYDQQSYNECRESSAMRVVEKEKANFCDYYKFGSKTKEDKSKKDLLNLANSLFKK